MSRKIQRSMWKDGDRRRSPRISAMDVDDSWKAQRPTRVRLPVDDVSQNARPVMENDSGNQQGPPSRTRARKKRKLRPVEDVVVCSAEEGRQSSNHEDHPTNSDQRLVVQAKEISKHEDHATYTGQSSTVSSVPWMPEKRTLEVVLDILQRRDSHEIFAEPVDPNEVEDYYEIIKEPMDFGTMRAKLHEGMYKNLEQFEHDVFLISRNAMHFNSSATVYFRQARAINELAKKVFHVLKTDPENFELECLVTRRRPGRRPQGEARGSNLSSCPKLATDVRSSTMTIDISLKGAPCSSGPSNLRRSIRVDPGCSVKATHVDTRDYEILSGARNFRRSNFFAADRRCTYRPWMPFLNEKESIVSTIHGDPKPLMHVNQKDIGYKESLMLFVKDLGPTAQLVAQRKLQGWLLADAPNCQTPSSNCWVQPPKCQIPAASASVPWGPSTPDTVITSSTSKNFLDHISGCPTVLKNTSHIMDLTDADKREKAYTSDRVGIQGASGGQLAANSDGKTAHGAFRREGLARNRMNGLGIIEGDKVHQNQSTEFQLGSYSTAGAGDLNLSVVGINKTGNKSTAMMVDKGKLDNQVHRSELVSEHSRSNVFEFMLGNNNSSTLSSQPLQTMGVSSLSQTSGSMRNLGSQFLIGDDQAIAAPGPSHGVSCSSQAAQASELNRPVPFIFNLPYLKSRLNQMNPLVRDRSLQPRLQQGSETIDKMSYERTLNCTHQAEPGTMPFLNNEQSSLDAQHTNLALQL